MAVLIKSYLFCFIFYFNECWFEKVLIIIGHDEFYFDRLVLESSKRRSLYEFGTDISINLPEKEINKSLAFIANN